MNMTLIKSFTIFIFLLGFGFQLSAQQTTAPDYFEGTISFTVQMKGPQAEMLKLNNPNDQLQMHIKDGNYIVNLMGGEFPKTFIFLADSNFEYSMDMTNRRAYRFSMHSDLNKEIYKKELTAKPTGKELEINGIMCQEYRLKRDEIYFTYYVSDKYRINLEHYPENTRAKASFLAEGLGGMIPLRTIKQEKGLTVITDLKKISRREFDPEQFQIPADFIVKNRDYRY